MRAGAFDCCIHIRKKLETAASDSSSAGGFYSKEAQLIRTAKVLNFTMDDLKDITFTQFMEVCEMASETTNGNSGKPVVRKATQADMDAFKYM